MKLLTCRNDALAEELETKKREAREEACIRNQTCAHADGTRTAAVAGHPDKASL